MPHDPTVIPPQRLWTPWRMSYVGNTGPRRGCVFCAALASNDDTANLVLQRGEHVFVILNLYPYNTGHLMVIPNDHQQELSGLTAEARHELADLVAEYAQLLPWALNCDGLNSGLNLGSAAGAGIAEHLHQHLVPRWSGDANFMPIVGGTKVLPELLPATYARLRVELARQAGNPGQVRLVIVDAQGRLAFGESRLPVLELDPDRPAWPQVRSFLAVGSRQVDLLGWAGPAPVTEGTGETPTLAVRVEQASDEWPFSWSETGVVPSSIPAEEHDCVERTLRMFPEPSQQ